MLLQAYNYLITFILVTTGIVDVIKSDLVWNGVWISYEAIEKTLRVIISSVTG